MMMSKESHWKIESQIEQSIAELKMPSHSMTHKSIKSISLSESSETIRFDAFGLLLC